ncbi:FAD-binding oxidoreductase [Acidisoma cellulosilytica]|uniref:FAD-binding oxidoreductase n=2 Tax=Acidisoma cellulosilyticum TaxID=2802395 RepID=A0A964E3T5_9PROT|nr:FAD-binding oxidoreductase [Acidisoma cellulosilyticum]
MPEAPADVLIVGAGIIALAAAQKLLAAGRQVTLVERGVVAGATSSGNAGALAFSDILPLATSGKIRRLPQWLTDPLGPLTIRPGYALQIAPWLLRFWRAGWPDRIAASIAAQVAMMGLAEVEMDRMIAESQLGDLIHRDGSLELYESEAEFKDSLPGWAQRTKVGIAFAHVSGAAMADLQPGLAPQFTSGTFVPGWRTVSDPFIFATRLAADVQSRGAVFLQGEASQIFPEEAGARVVLTDGRVLQARQIVIAGGAWSRRLTDLLGDRLPLETERGYNTTLPLGSFDLRRQLIFGGHGFVITPLTTGLRVGGAVEFGGLDLKPNFKRSAAMLTKAMRFLPGLSAEGGRPWMGFRPSMPDSLPVIGPSRASPHILYAFGHGHLGLTQSAGTGRLVADLLNGQTPAIDPSPFRPGRFRLG